MTDRLTIDEYVDFLARPWDYPKGQRESIIREKRRRAAKEGSLDTIEENQDKED